MTKLLSKKKTREQADENHYFQRNVPVRAIHLEEPDEWILTHESERLASDDYIDTLALVNEQVNLSDYEHNEVVAMVELDLDEDAVTAIDYEPAQLNPKLVFDSLKIYPTNF